MRMVKAAIGCVLLIGACGSEGPGGQGGEGDPANLVRLGEFDQGYLSGRLGTVSVDGEATSVEINQYDDDADCLGEGCYSYTNAIVRVDRPDGSWGMTILEIEGNLTDVADGDATVYVMGCSGPEADVMDWDVPANDIDTETQPDPNDPDSMILSVEVTFSDSDGRQERETWWGGSEDQPSESGDVVTTLLRVRR